ncbi:MAG: hypothetical protein EON58_16245 [Alphaproteobacteria bacterium]|nr:MAG: hypothetical protein EON58_16245 [Alphaproteobacteria bacterium]
MTSCGEATSQRRSELVTFFITDADNHSFNELIKSIDLLAPRLLRKAYATYGTIHLPHRSRLEALHRRFQIDHDDALQAIVGAVRQLRRAAG